MADTIVRNRAQCPKCKDVVESTHVHDFRNCRCGAISVDGGLEYLRRGWMDDRFQPIELSEIAGK